MILNLYTFVKFATYLLSVSALWDTQRYTWKVEKKGAGICGCSTNTKEEYGD